VNKPHSQIKNHYFPYFSAKNFGGKPYLSDFEPFLTRYRSTPRGGISCAQMELPGGTGMGTPCVSKASFGFPSPLWHGGMGAHWFSVFVVGLRHSVVFRVGQSRLIGDGGMVLVCA
jgi:hypothetical protein